MLQFKGKGQSSMNCQNSLVFSPLYWLGELEKKKKKDDYLGAILLNNKKNLQSLSMEELHKHTKQTALLRMALYAKTCLINLMTDGKMEMCNIQKAYF